MKRNKAPHAAAERRRLARAARFAVAVVLGLAASTAGSQSRGGGGGGGGNGGGGWGGGNGSWSSGSNNSSSNNGYDGSGQGGARRDADSRDPRGARDGRASMVDNRSRRVDQLLRDNPGRFERDLLGAPVLRGEVTVLLPAAAPLPDSLTATGFGLLREQEVLGRRLVVLRIPAGMSLPAAVGIAQQLLPEAEVDFNHVHLGSGVVGQGGRESALQRVAETPGPGAPALRVGFVDEALLPAPELRSTRIDVHSCGGVQMVPGHGTAVAAVIVRAAQRLGRPAHLYAADLACAGAGVDAIADALQWMDTERVPVVNISVVGPRNHVLEALVAAFLARGHLIVAAVGNDGPSASALYPAAYPGVVAVTAVDPRTRVLVEAGRGDHVAFAALGIVEVDVGGNGRLHRWRGTSFAAPVVAAELAARLSAPDPRGAADAVAALARSAIDLGEPGRDPVFGYGLVGTNSPAQAGVNRLSLRADSGRE